VVVKQQLRGSQGTQADLIVMNARSSYPIFCINANIFLIAQKNKKSHHCATLIQRPPQANTMKKSGRWASTETSASSTAHRAEKSVDANHPGPALARQRKAKRLSLAQVSALTQVSISTISRIENGHISPTYAVLARLAEALDVRWADLMGTREHSFAPGCRAVNRASSGTSHTTARGIYEWLGGDLTTKIMEPTIVEAIPDAGTHELEGHEGEEFLLVLEGSIIFLMRDYAPLQMDVGDSVYFDASMPHAYYGLTHPARFLSIVARPDGSTT